MDVLFQKGFTLIELMIVLGIISILAAIAYPSYLEHIAKSRRADAQAALSGLALAMERHFTESTPSSYKGAAAGGSDTGAPAIFATQAPMSSSKKYYNLTINTATTLSYSIYATPISAQANDKCGTLTLNSTSQRGIVNGADGVTAEDCWR